MERSYGDFKIEVRPGGIYAPSWVAPVTFSRVGAREPTGAARMQEGYNQLAMATCLVWVMELTMPVVILKAASLARQYA